MLARITDEDMGVKWPLSLEAKVMREASRETNYLGQSGGGTSNMRRRQGR
jgi:hypothetical protein